MKIEFENEEAIKEFYRNLYPYNNENAENGFIQRCKQQGYIKQSNLEEAREEYYKRLNEMESGHFGMENVKFEKSKLYHKYIKELEKEIIKLKEGK